jgi:hypothetical protein
VKRAAVARAVRSTVSKDCGRMSGVSGGAARRASAAALRGFIGLSIIFPENNAPK